MKSLFVLALVSCGFAACDASVARPRPPASLCSQEIPGAKQSLFEFSFNGDWAFTSDPWGYAIDDAASHIELNRIDQLPKGRVFRIDGDGTVHLASFSDGRNAAESTILHDIRGVTVAETIFNSDGNGWQRGEDFFFDTVEREGDRIVFTNVTDEARNRIHERLEVDAGGLVAHDKNGVVDSLELYRVEPHPQHSPVGTRRRLFREAYIPAPGRTIRVEQLPTRGICKNALPAKTRP